MPELVADMIGEDEGARSKAFEDALMRARRQRESALAARGRARVEPDGPPPGPGDETVRPAPTFTPPEDILSAAPAHQPARPRAQEGDRLSMAERMMVDFLRALVWTFGLSIGAFAALLALAFVVPWLGLAAPVQEPDPDVERDRAMIASIAQDLARQEERLQALSGKLDSLGSTQLQLRIGIEDQTMLIAELVVLMEKFIDYTGLAPIEAPESVPSTGSRPPP